MLILTLIRYLFGYVVLEVKGGFLERFLNLAARDHITLWDVQMQNQALHCKTTIPCFKRIRRAARASGTKVHIQEKCGLPFFLKQNKKRVGLFIGLFLFFCLLFLLSMRVWSIEVSGNVQIETEQIMEYAQEIGIFVGAKKRNLEAKQLSEQILENFPSLSWAAVNLDFCTVHVEVREAEAKPNMEDVVTPSNIVAKENGILTRLDVYSGKAMVLESSAVLKGDLLISGILENADGTERIKGAAGHAYATVQRPFSFSSSAQTATFAQTEKIRYVLCFFSWRLPLGLPLPEETFPIFRAVQHRKTVLPLGILEEHQRGDRVEKSLSNAESDLLAWMRFFTFEKACLLEGKILKEECFFNETDALHGQITLEKEIGEKQEIFLEKISD